MKCSNCQGRMKRGSAPFHVDRKGYHLSLDSVPARVCQQCGEPHFEETEVKAIQALLLQIDRKAAHLSSVA